MLSSSNSQEPVLVVRKDDAEKVDNNDNDYGLNYEEVQRKTRWMEKPCLYEGRWQDYAKMNKAQRDGYDKYEQKLAEEELRDMKFLGLI